MTPSTLIAVCCYEGDAHQVRAQMVSHRRSGNPVVVMSPTDSPVVIPPYLHIQRGVRAYIGEASLVRQLEYMRALLTFPHEYFLLHDSDSMMLSAEIPKELYGEGEIWSNEIQEPRPHASPYPKLAFQPPYFLSRDSVARMIRAGEKIPAHPITPYVDWFMNAASAEAGLAHRPFTDLERATSEIFTGSDPWEQLRFRIKYMGTNFVHPIKTPEQVKLCLDARELYERQQP